MSECSTFQDHWLHHQNYKDWIIRVKSNPNVAACRLCDKTLDISSMGQSALRSHMRSEKHQKRLSSMKSQENLNFNVSMPESKSGFSNEASAFQTQSSSSGKISSFMTKDGVLSSEFFWCINTVVLNHSFVSNENINHVFKHMFPDSEIASAFSCRETKTKYLTVFGIGEYYKTLLESKLQNEPYVLLFDESLNRELQKKQLDIHVRHWENGSVLSRYYTSDFLGHACALDLVNTFETKVEQKLGLSNIVQLSLDGPNVNWSAFDKLQQKIETDYNTKLINIGSCGLHIVHNAVRAVTKWDVPHQLSSLHIMFENVPARREDFELLTQSEFYPLPFCPHRWVENVKVCERAANILPYIKVYVEAVENKKVKNPGTRSYESVKSMVKDPLTNAKIQFLLSVCKQVEKFLVTYQTDKQMVFFLSKDLADMLRNLLDRFVKKKCHG